MATYTLIPPKERMPGPFAGQERRCEHREKGYRCVTYLNSYHAGRWCFAHEYLHLDEADESLMLEAA